MIKPSEEFLDSMKELLADEYDAFYKTYEHEAFKGIRFNRNKIKPEAMEELAYKLTHNNKRIPWTTNGFYYSEENQVSKSPYYAAGLFYIQEPSAMSPAAYLPVKEDDIVLDLCAAPGGKATELAARCRFLVANDISATRAQILLKNLEMAGCGNIAVTAENPSHLAEAYPEFFDSILVDAPCSGEGMFRKDASLIESYKERGPEYYHELQKEILESAYRLLKKGGSLLYSTCTFSRLEDEQTVLDFLGSHSDMEAVELTDRYAGFKEGYDGLKEAARLFPHHIEGEGHFLCLLRKKGELLSTFGNSRKKILLGEKEYLIPEDFDIKKGIRFLRTGLLLGEYKKDRFIPSFAYARSLKDLKEAQYPVLKLSYEDERVLKYLKGETIFAEESLPDGFVIIALENYSLGMGRINNGKIKNDLPKGYILN